jgi:hyperosmotically inducible protein
MEHPMLTFKHSLLTVVLALIAGFSGQALAADDDKPVNPDNTKINKRDRNPDEVTADQQKQNKEDIEITAKIRKAIVDDTTLSTNAHNVKIISMNGMVTLKGPVKSDAEKAAVEKAAVAVAGEKNVKNQIEIAP